MFFLLKVFLGAMVATCGVTAALALLGLAAAALLTAKIDRPYC